MRNEVKNTLVTLHLTGVPLHSTRERWDRALDLLGGDSLTSRHNTLGPEYGPCIGSGSVTVRLPVGRDHHGTTTLAFHALS